MDEWKGKIVQRLNDLEIDKRHIQELDARLVFQKVISESDRKVFHTAIQSIDREIETLKFELILDDMLASDLPLEEFMKRFDNKYN